MIHLTISQSLSHIPREDGRFTWGFFGNDYASLLSARKTFGCAPTNIAERVRSVTRELKNDYVELVSGFNATNRKGLLVASSFASRFLIAEKDNVFQQWVLLEVALQLIQETKDSDFVLVSDSHTFLKVLVKRLNKEGIKFIRHFPKYEPKATKLWQALSFAYHFCRYAIKSWQRRCYLKKAPSFSHDKDNVLIHTFYSNNNIANDQILAETYYPGLADVIRERNKHPVFWASLYGDVDLPKLIRCISNSGSSVVFTETHLRVSDYVVLFLKQLALLANLDRDEFLKSTNLAPFIRSSIFLSIRDMSITNAYLMAYGLERIISRVAPSTVIFEFEGQSWERLLVSRILDRFPHVRLHGYQHAHLANNLLSYYGSFEYADTARLPHRILVNGRAWRKWFIGQGCAEDRLHLAASLRYAELLSMKASTQAGGSSVLLVLSIGDSQALEALDKCISAFKDADLEVIVKPHPMCRHEHLLQILGSPVPQNFRFTYDPLRLLLPEAFVVIHIGTSAEVDAILLGLPVITIGQECGTQFSVVALLGDYVVYADTPEDVLHLTDHCRRHEGFSIQKDLPDLVRTQCFMPVTPANMEPFLS